MSDKKEFKGTVEPVRVEETAYKVFITDVIGERIAEVTCISLQKQKANAELIAEAFNVVTETGITPRQLHEKVKELETQLHSEKTDAFNYQCEAGVYQKANEKLQQQNEAYKSVYNNIMYVISQGNLEQARRLIEKLKTQYDE